MEPLTAEESHDLFLAILQATEDGDHETADALGDLAHDPEKLRAILAGEEEPDAKKP